MWPSCEWDSVTIGENIYSYVSPNPSTVETVLIGTFPNDLKTATCNSSRGREKSHDVSLPEFVCPAGTFLAKKMNAQIICATRRWMVFDLIIDGPPIPHKGGACRFA